MKKLVIITDAWAPQVNGVITSIKKTVALLEQEDFTVSIIHPGLFATVPIPFYPDIPLSLWTGRKMHRMLLEEKPDYIHIAVEGPLGLAARAACIKSNTPFTTAYHTNFPLYIYTYTHLYPLFLGTYAYLRWFHKRATKVFASTATLQKELTEHGITNTTISPLGVDTNLFSPQANPSIPNFPKPLFVYSGRIAAEKSLEDFLSLDLPGTKIIIGDGPERARLEKKYTQNTVFVGYKTHEELPTWLSACDVFVFPSRTETLGLVILEALACGLPVAAYPVMGPQDLITNGVDGALSTDLKEAAVACLKLSREKCREKALTYSWEECAEKFKNNLVPISYEKA